MLKGKATENMEKCPECGSKKLFLDAESVEIVCASCGYVIKENVEDTNPEWKAKGENENMKSSKVGAPTSLAMHDMGLSTVIGQADRDASGRPLVGINKSTVDRFRIWDNQNKMHDYTDVNLRRAFDELGRMSNKLSVPESIVEESAYIYRKVFERGLVKGRSINVLIAASLYAACRSLGAPRMLKGVAMVSRAKKRDIARRYMLILKELDIKMPIVCPINCINRVTTTAGISEHTTRKATKTLKGAIRVGSTVGKDPMSLAATALYVACVLEKETKTQNDIAEAANVIKVTIRNQLKVFGRVYTPQHKLPPNSSERKRA